jgi:protein ImuA
MAISPLLSPAFGALPTHLRERLWQADALVQTASSMASGFAVLDEQLPGGGWPTHGLTELLLAGPGIGELRLLAKPLATLSRGTRPIMIMAPGPLAGVQLYPDGWSQLGVDPARLLMIHTETLADQLWAIEQALKSAACSALLAWLPAIRPEALRRLQLAAASGGDSLAFLFRAATLRQEGTPATLRLLLESGSAARLVVHLLKRRGPILERPLYINLEEPRPWRTRPSRRAPSTIDRAVRLRHAMDRPLLPDTGTRLHPAPTA